MGQADIIRTARIFGDQINPSAAPGFQDVPFDLTGTDAKNSHFIYGYSGGLGVDVMLVSCLFLRAEWQYARFAAPIDTAVNTVHVGLGYKF
jgi:opacity protein-like surface antigen